jgi:hypothetical protein
MSDLSVHHAARDDADHMATPSHRRIRHDSHQPYLAAAEY